MGVTSLNTKKMLSSSLKKFMLKKPLSKITVSEIVADCGINRKTFYYHFEDISDLLKWTLEQEAFDIVKKFDLIHDTEEVISFVLTYVEENKAFFPERYLCSCFAFNSGNGKITPDSAGERL